MIGKLLLLVFLLAHADITYSKVHYITPSPAGLCLQNSFCLTLSQFAASSSDNETNISLFFMPGNHTLHQDLVLTRVESFSMVKDGPDNETVFVECLMHSGRFSISETISVSINGLHFIGCGSNGVSSVKWLTITNCTFQRVQERNTVFEITDVSVATIVSSSFLSNILLNHYTQSSSYIYADEVIDYVYFQQSTPNGVLHTTFSNVSIISSKFTHNRADIGGALVAHNSSLYIARSTFTYNTANFGGVMVTSGSTVNMDNNNFTNNTARESGGVMVTYNDTFTIISTTFTNNSATFDGGVTMSLSHSSFGISNSTFTNNRGYDGGVMETHHDSSFVISHSLFAYNRAAQGGVMQIIGHSMVTIKGSIFTNNNATAYFGGVMSAFDESVFDIEKSSFTQNVATLGGGVMATTGNSLLRVNSCIFTNNSAGKGGVMKIYGNSAFTISNSTFNQNSAIYAGGVMETFEYSSFTITNCSFVNNSARYGGVIKPIDHSTFNISHSNFVENKASYTGGVMLCAGEKAYIDNSNFSLNEVVDLGGGIIFTIQCSAYITNCIFSRNNGSIYTFNSKLTFGGNLHFTSSAEPLDLGNSLHTGHEAGAITSFQSSITFTNESNAHFSNNQASRGGAILATESTIMVYGEITIANNSASISGGGISLEQSRLEVMGKCQINNNIAMRGGGIHASSSTIVTYELASITIIDNIATKLGGGIYLEVNPKLYILRITPSVAESPSFIEINMNITMNHAEYGGAIYVADDMNAGACSSDTECFIQTLAVHQSGNSFDIPLNIFFFKNTANKQGPNLYGGLLDRCTPSPFAEGYHDQSTYYSGATYFGLISNTELDSISSQPVRVCFCNSEHEPDCSYQPPIIRAQKGREFNVPLVAVDQVNHTVDAMISSFLSSSLGGFGEGQQIQSVKRICSNLTFNLFSPHVNETLNLYADGPCDRSEPSTSHVTIQFIDCTCPVGFEPSSNSQSSTRCECVCDSALYPYITECDITISSVIRKGTNSWISYINATNSPGYVIYPNCPFDYCLTQAENVSIDFNLHNGADSQCAFNHTGVLCGSCQESISLSLAGSRCVPCNTYWPAMFVAILVAAAIGGILLVTVLLALNMTVSVGLINGFIFYANIVSAGSSVFLPSSEPSFPSVFVAWLNLDIGIDVCFIDGLDAYTKTWLQLAFPVYIITLVVMVIILSRYSPRFATLIGKKDPVSTLATLILLSYAKLLSITITALSYAVLNYPNGEQETVWLPDGNVQYFKGKHIPLVFVALFIVIFGLPYTILLLLWQWIVCAPRWKIFNWTRNTKLNTFIASYHVSCNSKYRYWTGLLLLVRVLLYIIASITASPKPQTLPLITGIFVGSLFLFKGVFGLRVHKKLLVDIVDTVLYFNLLVLSLFSQYDFKADITKQSAVAYTSTSITFILFIVVIFYHVALLVERKRSSEDVIMRPLVPIQLTSAKVTSSFVELPEPAEQDPSPREDKEFEPEQRDHS